MKKFSQIYEEVADLAKSQVLVVVDVQKEFEKFIPQGYVDKLNEYCKEFKEVYQIWDSHKAQKPTWKFNNEVKAITKKYGTTYDSLLKSICDKLENKYPSAKEGDKFTSKEIDGIITRIKNKHKWFHAGEELVNLFKSLKGRTVIVAGGATGECTSDIIATAESLGVKCVINYDYTYSAKTSNQQQV
jgi:nicotinamidase-related amidase